MGREIYDAKYRDTHREMIRKKKREKYMCMICNKMLCINHRARHERSNIHQIDHQQTLKP